jgi:hypothetical protein
MRYQLQFRPRAPRARWRAATVSPVTWKVLLAMTRHWRFANPYCDFRAVPWSEAI